MNHFYFSNQILLSGNALVTGVNNSLTGIYIPSALARRATLTYLASGTLGNTQKISLCLPSPFENNVNVEFFSFNKIGDGYIITGLSNSLPVPQINIIVTGSSGSCYASIMEQN